jgi:predicted metal-dependent peptidase
VSNVTSVKKTKEITDRYKDKPVTGKPAEEVLATARLKLICDFPFFGKIALNMVFVENNHIPTTAVDVKGRFYYNRKWVNHFTMEDAVFEMGHEVMHLVQRCFARKPAGSDHGLWNKAADWLCDTSLVDTGMKQSSISVEMVDEKTQEKTRELGTIEKVYKFLLQDAENNTTCPACKQALKKLKELAQGQDKSTEAENKQINSENGGESPGDGGEEDSEESSAGSGGEGEGDGHDHGEGEGGGCGGEGDEPQHTCGNIRGCCVGTTADLGNGTPMDEQKWTEVIVGAKIHAEGKGNMPAGLGEMINTLTESKVRWQDYLRTAATKIFGRNRYTYLKRNRRGHAMNIRFPGHTPDGKSAIITVDTSASMSEDEVRQCITEGAEILRLCGCQKIWLILHDMRVYFSGYVTEADLTKLKIARGGTSHREVFACLERRHANEEFNVPTDEIVSLAVMFTDLGTDFPDYKPDFDVLWGVPSDGCPGMSAPVPFGIKVSVEMNDG